MDGFFVKDGRVLRTGYTTGSCAAAAAMAAARMLFLAEAIPEVLLETPSGARLRLRVEDSFLTADRACCCVQKDAGDDPDVTDGIRIFAEVSVANRTKCPLEIKIEGGKGVGRVTRPGLSCAVGEAAINPVPRRMIAEAVRKEAESVGFRGVLSVVISAENGEALAEQTFNPRLGIIGGISILGTSGIVEPMSEKALLETIRLEISQKTAEGQKRLLICPGNYGRDFAQKHYGIDLDTGIKCSNYVGEALDYAVYKGVSHILLIGHAGKLSKLAAGVMNTHSRVADCRRELFAVHAVLAGASREQARLLMEALTTDDMDERLEEWGLSEGTWRGILEKIEETLRFRVGRCCQAEAVLFTRRGVRMTAGARELLKEFRTL